MIPLAGSGKRRRPAYKNTNGRFKMERPFAFTAQAIVRCHAADIPTQHLRQRTA